MIRIILEPGEVEAGTEEEIIIGQKIRELEGFYGKHRDMLVDDIVPIFNQSSSISLRLIEDFIKNGGARMGVTIQGKGQTIEIMTSRNQWLKRHKVQCFNMYRKLGGYYAQILLDGVSLAQTSIGQLNYFRWLSLTGLLGFMKANLAAIVAQRERGRESSEPAQPKISSEIDSLISSIREIGGSCTTQTRCTSEQRVKNLWLEANKNELQTGN
jgi:hypothetical protein